MIYDVNALSWQAYFGHIEVLKLLVENQADVNATVVPGQTLWSYLLDALCPLAADCFACRTTFWERPSLQHRSLASWSA